MEKKTKDYLWHLGIGYAVVTGIVTLKHYPTLSRRFTDFGGDALKTINAVMEQMPKPEPEPEQEENSHD